MAGLDSREDDGLAEIELIYSILDDINQARPAFGRPAVCIIQVIVTRNGTEEETTFDGLYFGRTTGKIPLLAIPDSRFVNRALQAVGASSAGNDSLLRTGARNFVTQEPYENVVQELLYQLGFDYLERGVGFDLPIFRLLEDVVRTLTDDTDFAFHTIRRSGRTGFEILVKTAGSQGPLPIQSASQGTLSVLAIFGLIHSYLQTLRPKETDDGVLKTPAIVFVDELDAHLHPSWQQKVVAMLTGKFPNVQFILSAHSPLIVAGCDQGEVTALRRNKATGRFLVETIGEDFLGATAREIYDRLFEIEDSDRLYLEYSRKASIGGDTRSANEIDRLESKDRRKPEEEQELIRLYKEKRLIQRAAEVRDRKLKEAETEARVDSLAAEVERLRLALAAKKGKGPDARFPA